MPQSLRLKTNGWPVGPEDGDGGKTVGRRRLSRPGRCPSLGEPTPLRGTQSGANQQRKANQVHVEGRRACGSNERRMAFRGRRTCGPKAQAFSPRRRGTRAAGRPWQSGRRREEFTPQFTFQSPFGLGGPTTLFRTVGERLARWAERRMWRKNGGRRASFATSRGALRWANRRPSGHAIRSKPATQRKPSARRRPNSLRVE